MCGRFSVTASAQNVMDEFSVTGLDWIPPRYNIAPTQPVLVVREGRLGREIVLMRWGLVPRWAKDPSRLPLLFNARADTLDLKPAFRGALRHRRVVVPASGFYEWRRSPDGRQKEAYYFRPRDGRLLALAGLWEDYSDDKGNEVDTVTIVTTEANGDVSSIHDRMPVIIPEEMLGRWIGGDRGREGLPLDLLGPSPSGLLEAIPVGPRVNSAANDDAALQEPVAPSSRAAEEKDPLGTQLDLF